MSNDVSEWHVIGAAPIRPDAPSGDSVRYDPIFEKLQSEVNKLESLSGQSVDWKSVITLCREILQTKSKDILVASYLCRGLFEEYGYTGLLDGLSCLVELVQSFWDTLYPEAKRMRGRINAAGWLSANVGIAVPRKDPSRDDFDTIKKCVSEVERLEGLLDEKIGSDSPGLGTLKHALRGHLRILESSITPPSVEAKTAAPTKPIPLHGTAAPVIINEVTSSEDARRAIQDAGNLIRRAASYVRSQDPAAPWPYRLTRTLTWMEMVLPASNPEGETRIPPPPERLHDHFRSLHEQKSWTEISKQAEAIVHEYPFWLDIHYFIALALSNSGDSYAAAKEAVGFELYTLLRRLPELPGLRFSDGTPFADDQTRIWIESKILTIGGDSSKGEATKAADQDGEISQFEKIRNESRSLAGDGKLKEAISIIQQGINSVSSSREEFLLRFDLSKLCMEGGHLKAAVSQLDLLDRQIIKYSLEEWEPALCMEVLQNYWFSLNKLMQDSKQQSQEIIGQADMVYRRLCSLDVLKVLDLDKKRSGWGILQR